MPRPVRRLVCVLACLALAACVAHTSAPQAARTHYESLDMASPQATARRFVAAWAAQDFMTVHLLLAPQAELEAARAVDAFAPQRLVPDFDATDGKASQVYPETPVTIEQIASGDMPIQEFDTDPTRRFDALLMQAARRGKLPFALARATRVDVGSVDDADAVVTLHTPGAQTLTLSLQRQSSGRWKVDQVRWPGSDPRARPWDGASGPARGADTIAAVDEGQPRTFYDALDMRSPDATVRTFLDAWSRQDFLAVYHLLSPSAEWAALTAMDGLAFERLVPGVTLAQVMDTPIMAVRPLTPEARTQERTPYNEYNLDPSRKFDTLLLRAASLERLPLALRSDTRAEPARVDDDTAIVALHTPDAPALAVHLVALPSGRWKIDRIDRPDATAPMRPWGVPTPD